MPFKTLWQTHCSTLVPLPLYVNENKSSSCFPLLKNISPQILFHFCTAWMPSLYTGEVQQPKNHSMVPYCPKHCGKFIAQLSCLYLYMSQRLTRVLVSLFSKKKLSSSLFIFALHACQVYMQVYYNKQKKSKHGALPSKTFWQVHPSALVTLSVYAVETNQSSWFPLLKNISQQILFHSAPHAWQVYRQVNDNKQNKSQHGVLPLKSFWQIHGSTLVPLPVYFDETDRSSDSILLKNECPEILFHFCTTCMPSLYYIEWQQTKNHKWYLSIWNFVKTLSLNSRALTWIFHWDQYKYLFHYSQK